MQSCRRQRVRPTGSSGGPREFEVVRASGARERAVGDAGCGRNASAGGFHEDRNHQRASMVRRRKSRVLRVVFNSVRDRVHPVPLRRNPEMAGH